MIGTCESRPVHVLVLLTSSGVLPKSPFSLLLFRGKCEHASVLFAVSVKTLVLPQINYTIQLYSI